MQWLRLQVFQLAFNRLDEGFGSRGQQARMGRSDQEWPKPQPLVAKVASLPYPLDALPTTVRAAVEEVLEFTKAPVPLVASSALAALSLANQSHADVKRAEKLSGPTGLFLLTIADSGERKSTCDGFHEGHPRLRGAASRGGKPLVKDRSAALAAWEAKHNGIKDQIRQLAKKGDPTGMREAALRDLEHDKPELLRIPRLIYGDATPEAFKWNLARQWPSGGVISGEGGIVFESHGMGKDSVMRNLATLKVANPTDAKTASLRDIRIAKVIAMLEDHQETRYALATDLLASPDGVTLTIAIRGVAAFEMLAPTKSYDALRLLELVQLLDPPTSIH